MFCVAIYSVLIIFAVNSIFKFLFQNPSSIESESVPESVPSLGKIEDFDTKIVSLNFFGYDICPFHLLLCLNKLYYCTVPNDLVFQ